MNSVFRILKPAIDSVMNRIYTIRVRRTLEDREELASSDPRVVVAFWVPILKE